MHNVGQLVHNVHKTKRVLQKTNFGPQFKTENVTAEEKALIDKVEKAHSDKLERGEPSYYSQILKHLLFKSSN